MSLVDPGYEPPQLASQPFPSPPPSGAKPVDERRRDRALELAVATAAGRPASALAVVQYAQVFERFLLDGTIRRPDDAPPAT